MSPDRRRRTRRIALAVPAVAVVAAAGWALLPRDLGAVRVEQVRILPPGMADGSRKPDYLATPTRIAVTFAVAEDLAVVRDRLGMGYIAARLADCADRAASADEVIVQRAGYLADYGRVVRLPKSPGGGLRYRATFDDELTKTVDHQARNIPMRAVPGGLCFSLYGARMWLGEARSQPIPIGPVAR